MTSVPLSQTKNTNGYRSLGLTHSHSSTFLIKYNPIGIYPIFVMITCINIVQYDYYFFIYIEKLLVDDGKPTFKNLRHVLMVPFGWLGRFGTLLSRKKKRLILYEPVEKST